MVLSLDGSEGFPLPTGLGWSSFSVSGGALDAEYCALIEGFEIGGACVGAGASDTCDDMVDEVFDAWAFWIEIDPAG